VPDADPTDERRPPLGHPVDETGIHLGELQAGPTVLEMPQQHAPQGGGQGLDDQISGEMASSGRAEGRLPDPVVVAGQSAGPQDQPIPPGIHGRETQTSRAT